MALPTRGPGPAYTHQWADIRRKKTTVLQPGEPSLQTQARPCPGASWSLDLRWQEESVLLRHTGHPLPRAISPRWRNVTNPQHNKNTNRNLDKLGGRGICCRQRNKIKSYVEEQLSEVEIGSQPQKRAQSNDSKMSQELRRRMDAQSKKSEVLNKELENIKNNKCWRIQ